METARKRVVVNRSARYYACVKAESKVRIL